MKVGAEITEPRSTPIGRLTDAKELQDRLDNEVILTALRVATVTSQNVPVDEGTLRNSYHVHHRKSKPSNPNPLSPPPDKMTAVVGSVLKYAPKIENSGGIAGKGAGAFVSAFQVETNGFPQRIGKIVKDYLNGK